MKRSLLVAEHDLLAKYGKITNSKRVGPYVIGSQLGSSPVHSITQHLARKINTDEFYTLKILLMDNKSEESQDDRQGKMLMYTEYQLMSLLKYQDGVVHHHGLFHDEISEYDMTTASVKRRKRLVLVLDCLVPHGFDPNSNDYINLQHYVIKEKKLTEKEAVIIFFDIVHIVECLHKKNIVHRDLKLGNMVLNKSTRRVILTNFCLGKHLMNENNLLKDQRGSPAYISPDVLSGKPYLGKPSDMWALGVVLFTMLYGQFPFYDSIPQELFKKIKAADFQLPQDGRVSGITSSLVKELLLLDPSKRLTASKVMDSLRDIIASWKCSSIQALQVVPDITDENYDHDEFEKCIIPPVGESEFERKVQEINSNFEKNINNSMPKTIETCKSLFVQSQSSVNGPPITKLKSDARSLNANERKQYKIHEFDHTGTRRNCNS